MTDSQCCGSPSPSGHNRYSICNGCGAECKGCGGCGMPGDEDKAQEQRQSRDRYEAWLHDRQRQWGAEEGP